MTKLILPAEAAGLTFLNAMIGIPSTWNVHSSNVSYVSGNGFLNGVFPYWRLHGIENPSAANSRQVDLMTMENWVAGAMPWGQKWALTFRLKHFSLEKQGSLAIGFGEIPNVATHDLWRTNATQKRAIMLVERTGGGVTTWYTVLCNGAAVSAVVFTAITASQTIEDNDVALIFTPGDSLEIFVNGQSRIRSIVALPAASSGFLASMGAWQTPIAGAPGNFWRLLGPTLIPIIE